MHLNDQVNSDVSGNQGECYGEKNFFGFVRRPTNLQMKKYQVWQIIISFIYLFIIFNSFIYFCSFKDVHKNYTINKQIMVR